ncbi:MAG: endopeptidase La [Deltaproteobacteria bacterium]|jgi:ATP-dependent Lon protease|nr:endopeptidase La [Deltaproteobacteria bacterium]
MPRQGKAPPQAATERRSELSIDLVRTEFALPEVVAFLPMTNLNCFPQIVTNIAVDRRFVPAAAYDGDSAGFLGLFALKNPNVDPLQLVKDDFYRVGVVVKILEVSAGQDDDVKLTVKGLRRLSLVDLLPDPDGGPSLLVRTGPVDEPGAGEQLNVLPLMLEAKRLFAHALNLQSGVQKPPNFLSHLLEDEPVVLADLMMALLPFKPHCKAEYLMLNTLEERYRRLLELLTEEVSNREAGLAISRRVELSFDRRRKEILLQEQLKAIQAELGVDDDVSEIDELGSRLTSLNLPENVKITAERELKRLKHTPIQSAEYSTTRNYLEWIAELPWTEGQDELNSLELARNILDRDHFGLEPVKKRILEYLAVRNLTKSQKMPILCLTGPPGVGKTSLARSVAEALGRKFVRMSLGGLRDEAEIRGHRRTYVGSRPGRILAELKKAGVNNPVFLLDELDKMSASPMGDPGSALLEVLDPEQNETFVDHFLEAPFDLSKIFFIVTANVLDHLPPALRDRLETVEVDGYALEEKTAIASRHLWPKVLAKNGLLAEEAIISEEALKHVVSAYTWEAGCRELSRRLGAVARARAVAKAERRVLPAEIGFEELREILGPPRRLADQKEKLPQSGVVAGLAWTAKGGEIMFVEAVAMPGEGRLALTGQLGEIMKESAQTAISYVRSRAADWSIDQSWFKSHDLHIHLPHGAVPKDGPSAGVSLATAVVSLASGRKVRPDVAMTGEISLRGLVLPVGGLKEKLLAAKRAGIAEVVVPESNQPDLAVLPSLVTEGLAVVPAANLDQVLAAALEDGAVATAA